MYIEKLFKKYKSKINGDLIFDPIRKKEVHNTPEETIRQKTVCFLLNELHIPESQLIVEKSLSTLGVKGNKKRIDIGILDTNHSLVGLVECKAFFINYNESPYQQAIDYVSLLDAKYYFICDGVDFIGYRYEKESDQFIQIEELPNFNEILQT